MPSMSERIYQAAQTAGTAGLTNEIQRLSIGSGTPESGSMTLDNGTSTLTLSFDQTAAALETAFEGLDEYEPDDIVCSGGPLPGTPIDYTFQNRLEGAVAALTVTDIDLSAGTPAVATTQEGSDGVRKDLRQAAEVFDLAIKQIWSDAGLDSGAAPWIGAVEDQIIQIVNRVAVNLRT